MEAEDGLMTAAAMAKELGVSEGKVKKAIKDIALEPNAKRGVCCLYDQVAMDRITGKLTS